MATIAGSLTDPGRQTASHEKRDSLLVNIRVYSIETGWCYTGPRGLSTG